MTVKRFIMILSAVILAASAHMAGPASAATTAYLRFDWTNGGVMMLGGQSYNKNGHVLVAATNISSVAGVDAVWNAKDRSVTFKGGLHRVVIRAGSATAEVDGKPANMGVKAVIIEGKLYVPLRFFCQLFGASVKWDAIRNTAYIHNLQVFSHGTYDGVTYIVEKYSGDLYMSRPDRSAVKIGKLDEQLYDWVTFQFNPTDGGNLLLTIHDSYGEPHFFSQDFSLLLNDGDILRQSHVKYAYGYHENIRSFNGDVVMTDGRELDLVDDTTGAVKKHWNLTELGGEETNYFIEWMSEYYLLIRPNSTNFLTLVDLRNNTKQLMYETLLDNVQQKDVLDHHEGTNVINGDYLHFIKQEGNTLYFSYDNSYSGEKATLQYQLYQ